MGVDVLVLLTSHSRFEGCILRIATEKVWLWGMARLEINQGKEIIRVEKETSRKDLMDMENNIHGETE